ncbi:MAG TPA: hypothetical protein VE994_02235 [Terriglobales bacterium]|nr:hypothetical protein [Terriglobales bacterium]
MSLRSFAFGDQTSIMFRQRLAAFIIILLLASTAVRAQTAQQAELAALRPRITDFIEAWLVQRNVAHTIAFVDDSAYKDKPAFGEGCEGWLKPHMPLERARKTLGGYLIDTANSYPPGTDVRQMLVNLSTAEWASYAVNDVSTDRYIVMRIDEKSVNDLFEGKKNPYHQILARHLKDGSPIYWTTFGLLLPNHEAFVIYAGWQHLRDNWYISTIDVTCPGL